MIDYPAYKDIKIFYDWGCYTNEEVGLFVQFGKITPEEYKMITGEDYPQPEFTDTTQPEAESEQEA